MVQEDEATVHQPGNDRTLTFAAFLLLVTAVWLPWWVVSYENDAGVTYDRLRVSLFQDAAPAAFPAATIVTGVLVLLAPLVLFFRLAGRSWYHEPAHWRRDLLTTAVLVAAALLSVLWWPDAVPHFWGGRTFALEDAPGAFTETALPGLGWWLALAALLSLLAARVVASLAARPGETPGR